MFFQTSSVVTNLYEEKFANKCETVLIWTSFCKFRSFGQKLKYDWLYILPRVRVWSIKLDSKKSLCFEIGFSSWNSIPKIGGLCLFWNRWTILFRRGIHLIRVKQLLMLSCSVLDRLVALERVLKLCLCFYIFKYLKMKHDSIPLV